MANQPAHLYGGQAVIEGVMIRGRDFFSLAVRRDDGSIEDLQQRLSPIYNGRLRRLPLVRGVLTLIETLVLGIKALQISADLAATSASDKKADGEGIPGWLMGITLAFSLVFGIALFFLLPLGVVRVLEPTIGSGLVSEAIEGVLRLAILVGYVAGIGMMRDIRRVYAYHGAEHMTVHAHEAGLPLNVDNVRKFGTPASPLRYRLPVDCSTRIRGRVYRLCPAGVILVVANCLPHPVAPRNRCGQLRGYPVQRTAPGRTHREAAGRAGTVVAAADDSGAR